LEENLDRQEMPERVRFVAVLVFTREPWRFLEPRTFAASHPEIAYRLAMEWGREKAHRREFLGLADLYVQESPADLRAVMEQGDAAASVVEKSRLCAFSDPRWSGVPCDHDELRAALAEPPLLVDLMGLGNVAWKELSHAYGPAEDVPGNLRRLASTDIEAGIQALRSLVMSVFHQETFYTATAPVLPFLVEIVSHPRTPMRSWIASFLSEVAAVSGLQPGNPEAVAAREQLRGSLERFETWQSDPDPDVRDPAARLLRELRGI